MDRKPSKAKVERLRMKYTRSVEAGAPQKVQDAAWKAWLEADAKSESSSK